MDVVASHFGIEHPLRPLPDPRVLAALRCIASNLQQGEAAFFTRLDEVADEVDRATIRGRDFDPLPLFPSH